MAKHFPNLDACGDPPRFGSMMLKGLPKTLYLPGDRIEFKCRLGYKPVVPPLTTSTVCQPDNTWAPLQEACTKTVDSVGVQATLSCCYRTSGELVEESSLTPPHSQGTKGRADYFCIMESDTVRPSSMLLTKIRCFFHICPPKKGKGKNERVAMITGSLNPLQVTSFGKEGACRSQGSYYLIGTKSIYCELFGNTVDWSDSPPQCEKVLCQPPGKISNGKYSNSHKDIFEYNEVVTYRCNPSNGPDEYSLVGESRLVCSGHNAWSSDPPECKVVKCEYPVLENGIVVSGFGRKYYYKAQVVFECLEGFHLKGSSTVFCGADSTWEPEIPECVKGTKGHPTPSDVSPSKHVEDLGIILVINDSALRDLRVLHGNIGRGGEPAISRRPPRCFQVGMRPEYSQAHGGAGGAGAASAPTRVRPQLGPRSAPAGPATPPGTEAPPCSSPIVPARRRYVTAATPTWDGPRRFSEICGLLRLVTALETVNSHSRFVFSLIAHKMTAFCAPRRAPPRRPERPLYSWSFVGILLTALVLLLPTPSDACGDPPRFQTMKLTNASQDPYSPGDQVEYECRLGYKRLIPLRDTTAVCQPDNTWTPLQEACTRRSCPQLGDPINGQVNGTFLFGSKVHYVCNEGFYLLGPQTLYCELTGDDVSWDDAPPTCERILCKPPAQIKNGKYTNSHKDTFEYHEVVTYSCNPSGGPDEYSLVGESQLICSGHVSWSSEPPECKVVKCPYPALKNGNIISGFGRKYYYKARVLFKCLQGFSLKGNNTIVCGANSTWEPEMPECIKVPTPPSTKPPTSSHSVPTPPSTKSPTSSHSVPTPPSTKPPIPSVSGHPTPNGEAPPKAIKDLDASFIAVIVLTVLVGIAVVGTCVYKCLHIRMRGEREINASYNTSYSTINQPLQKSRLTKWFLQMSVTLCLLILVKCQDLH
ncbi:complement receptor type 1-like [Hipposideros larvatus]